MSEKPPKMNMVERIGSGIAFAALFAVAARHIIANVVTSPVFIDTLEVGAGTALGVGVVAAGAYNIIRTFDNAVPPKAGTDEQLIEHVVAPSPDYPITDA